MSVSMANILANVTVTAIYLLLVTWWLGRTYALKKQVNALTARIDNLEILIAPQFLSDEEFDEVNGI